MTTITKTCSIVFSPTHTSQKVANVIMKGTVIPDATPYNFTLPPVSSLHIDCDTLVVFAAPVYGGHIPPIAIERMKKVTGEQSPAIVVVVYGNRDYEHALEEFAALVRQQGFKVIAAATFIGEHSYSTRQYPISAGRPNKNDLLKAETFGQEVAKKISNESSIQEIDVKQIERPEQSLWTTLRFIAKVLRVKGAKKTVQPTPSITDISSCTHCGICAENCPTQAISIGEEQTTDFSRCIRCCACVKMCPLHIRIYETPFSQLLSTCYAREKEPHTLL